MRCLVAIVDAGMNVSAAAQSLHLSQPSVSRQLAQIEQALGVRLFARRGRGLVSLTPAGGEVLAIARRMVDDYGRLRRLAGNQPAEGSEELAIVAPQGYALHVLPPLLRQLCDAHPSLSVRLRTLGEGEPMRPADHPAGDLFMTSTAGDEGVEPGSVPLFRWRRVAIVERWHPLSGFRGPLPLEELVRWPLVTYEAARREDSSFRRVMSAAGLQPQFACSAQDPQTLKAYARAGLGVGLVAEFALCAADHDDFAVIELDARLPECIAWALLPRSRSPRPIALSLLQLLAPHIEPERIQAVLRGEADLEGLDPPSYVRAAPMLASALA
nr:LysR substrate-binding domain-containing protein [Lysobacter sp. CAU 1642]